MNIPVLAGPTWPVQCSTKVIYSHTIWWQEWYRYCIQVLSHWPPLIDELHKLQLVRLYTYGVSLHWLTYYHWSSTVSGTPVYAQPDFLNCISGIIRISLIYKLWNVKRKVGCNSNEVYSISPFCDIGRPSGNGTEWFSGVRCCSGKNRYLSITGHALYRKYEITRSPTLPGHRLTPLSHTQASQACSNDFHRGVCPERLFYVR